MCIVHAFFKNVSLGERFLTSLYAAVHTLYKSKKAKIIIIIIIIIISEEIGVFG